MSRNNFIHRDLVIVFVLTFLVFLPNLYSKCSIYLDLNFDSQMFVTWIYTVSKNYLPFQDVFYPYGYFYYFKSSIFLLAVIDLLLKSSLFTIIYLMFRCIFNKRIFAVTSFIAFFIFVILHTGSEVFSRYGILVAFIVLTSLGIVNNLIYKAKYNISMGLFSGLTFFLVPDQAVLCVFGYILSQAFGPLLKSGFSRKVVYPHRKIIKCSLIYFAFLAISIIPFVTFLFLSGDLQILGQYVKEIATIAQFAKIPFPPSLKSIDNIFSLVVLVLAISTQSYRYFLVKVKPTKHDIVLFGLVISLIILEQKNILRSIDSQISFVSFLILYVLIAGIIRKSKLRLSIFICFIVFFEIVLLFGGMKTSKNILKSFNEDSGYAHTSRSHCIDKNLEKYKKGPMGEVYDFISKIEGKKTIFSFPSDPIFYVIFDQKPPYYLSIYEASFKKGQESRMHYIAKNNVNYIIINTNILSIQDNVPDVVRAKYELSYILNNFEYLTKIEKYLILKKGKKENIFDNKVFVNDSYIKNLLNINLESIPFSQAKQIKNNIGSPISTYDDLNSFNESIANNGLVSTNKVLLFKSLHNNQILLRLTDLQGLTTNVSMRNCKNNCLLNLQSMPQFYNVRRIVSVNSNDVIIQIKLYENKNLDIW